MKQWIRIRTFHINDLEEVHPMIDPENEIQRKPSEKRAEEETKININSINYFENCFFNKLG